MSFWHFFKIILRFKAYLIVHYLILPISVDGIIKTCTNTGILVKGDEKCEVLLPLGRLNAFVNSSIIDPKHCDEYLASGYQDQSAFVAWQISKLDRPKIFDCQSNGQCEEWDYNYDSIIKSCSDISTPFRVDFYLHSHHHLRNVFAICDNSGNKRAYIHSIVQKYTINMYTLLVPSHIQRNSFLYFGRDFGHYSNSTSQRTFLFQSSWIENRVAPNISTLDL